MKDRPSNTSKLLLFLATAALVVLHQDWWNWDKVDPLVFGFLPIGLAYHAAYAIACAVLMWCFVQFLWPRQLEEVDEADGAKR
jgi:hypothetical protein